MEDVHEEKEQEQRHEHSVKGFTPEFEQEDEAEEDREGSRVISREEWLTKGKGTECRSHDYRDRTEPPYWPHGSKIVFPKV